MPLLNATLAIGPWYSFAVTREAIQASFTATAFRALERTFPARVIRVESAGLQPPVRTAERAVRPVERYTARIDPPALIAGGATAREEIQ